MCGATHGFLGLKSDTLDMFAKVPFPHKIIAVAARYSHVVLLSEDGTIWACGDNNYGQLGLGEEYLHVNCKNFMQVRLPGQDSIKFVKIATGLGFTGAVDQQGNVWVFGANELGQLGVGDTEYRDSPTRVPSLQDIKFICSGLASLICLNASGQVWNTGVMIQVPEVPLDNRYKTTPQQIVTANPIVTIASGVLHLLMIDTEGNVLGCGENISGQLGFGDFLSRREPEKLTSIEHATRLWCGDDYSVVEDQEGRLWMFGENFFRQFGFEMDPNQSNFLQSEKIQNLLDSMNTFVNPLNACLDIPWQLIHGFYIGFQKGTIPRRISESVGICHPKEHPIFRNVQEIFPHPQSIVFVDHFGEIYTAGDNEYAQLGRGISSERLNLGRIIETTPITFDNIHIAVKSARH